ncbi:MFS transporter, partial [Halomonas sp. MG34]|nr:MFS transporter [Halomonas sp. MG34]
TISIVLAIAMFSGMILMPIYIQTIRGISPMDSGLLMLPGAILMGIMSPITGRLFDKYGARLLALIGLTITIATTYSFSRLSLDTSYGTIMLIYTIRMFGMSMVMMPIMTNGLNQMPMKDNPHGTAMNNTLQQVSGAIGSALLITVMNNRTETKATELSAAVDPSTLASQQAAAEVQADILNQSMLSGINFSFLVSTFIAILAFVLAFFIKRVQTSTTNPEPKGPEKETEGILNKPAVATES